MNRPDKKPRWQPPPQPAPGSWKVSGMKRRMLRRDRSQPCMPQGQRDTELLHPTCCWSTTQSTFPTGTHHFSIRATLCSSQLLPSFEITNSVTFSHQVVLASRTQADMSLCFIWISNSLERRFCSQSPVVFATVETLTGQGEEVIPLQANQ